ncbi:hypothetical protein HGRIS_001866 [Hohenbuehelia grisea]|uniref:HAM1-like N-terminal domain-containing protein n=1 Tax=Hohenbuehelia grisea TaxID=104357 RepID=A0ABR3JJP8_9AGAR
MWEVVGLAVVVSVLDGLAAYNTGKLPTQLAQLNHEIDTEFLDADVAGYGPLSRPHCKGDWRRQEHIQDFIYKTRRVPPVPVRIHAEETHGALNQDISSAKAKAPDLPTELELARDASTLINSLKSLVHLLIRSSAFHLILSDILTTARKLVAEGAAQAATLAHDVEVAADDVRKVAQFGEVSSLDKDKATGREIARDIQDAASDAADGLRHPEMDSVEDARDAVIGRLQEVRTRTPTATSRSRLPPTRPAGGVGSSSSGGSAGSFGYGYGGNGGSGPDLGVLGRTEEDGSSRLDYGKLIR